eukprot:m.15451 g.15451  ORF g.15451 m.15451 type:complete len:617 (+) comp3266_c0_seq1:64-1914(+)
MQGEASMMMHLAPACPNTPPASPRVHTTSKAHAVVVEDTTKHAGRTSRWQRFVEVLQAAVLAGALLAAVVVTFRSSGVPSGTVFQTVLLWLLSTVAASALDALQLPALCGPLLVGVLLGNVGMLDAVTPEVRRILKGASVALIMLRAGLSLNLRTLMKSGRLTLLLASVPCLVETAAAATASLLLFDVMVLPWAVMLGFALSDVSPAVTVPLLTDLKNRMFGTEQGIPTVLLAAGSLNSVLCIVCFEISMQFAVASDGASVPETIGRGVGGLFAGVLVGGLAGTATRGLIAAVPRGGLLASGTRQGMALLLAAFVLYFGFGIKGVNLGGAGTMACVAVGAAFAHTRRQGNHAHHDDMQVVIVDEDDNDNIGEVNSTDARIINRVNDNRGPRISLDFKAPSPLDYKPVSGPEADQTDNDDNNNNNSNHDAEISAQDALKYMWETVGQMFLFGLLGGALELKRIPPPVLGKAVALILLALPFRLVATYYTAALSKWSFKERLFTAVSYLPKATVQAALSTVALQYVEGHEADYDSTDAYTRDLDRSMLILAAATLSIIITAPAGAVAIGWSGPRLLRQAADPSGRYPCDHGIRQHHPEIILSAQVLAPVPTRLESTHI